MKHPVSHHVIPEIPYTACMKRPQNISRPWKIEYKNADGNICTFPSSYTTALNAVRAAHDNWIRNYAEDDSDAVIKADSQSDAPITDAQNNNGFVVYTDGFHTYTVFHRDSVYHS